MQHSEKQQHPTENKSTSQPLRIDTPDSAHEKAAESVADKLARNGQVMGSDNTMNGQIAGNTKPKNGMIAPAEVKDQISSAKGSGDKLPDSVKRMVKGKSGELDDVRMHTDSGAAKLAKSVNAEAFTYGKDIFFDSGKFDIYTSQGKELIAHELSHAVANTESGEHVIQRKAYPAFSSYWGTWQATKFDEAPNITNPHAIAATIKFTPGAKVTDAQKIGFVQTIQMKLNNTLTFPVGRSYWERDIEKKDGVYDPQMKMFDEGFAIDREILRTDPLIQAGKTKPGAKIGETAEESKSSTGYSGHYGKRYIENGAVISEAVTLEDTPKMANAGPGSKVTLETTPLVVEGTQVGSYLGSVKWGWEIDQSGTFIPHPPEVASNVAVTSTFIKAASLWNESLNHGEATIDLPPTPVIRVAQTGGTNFYSDPNDLSTGTLYAAGTRFMVLQNLTTDLRLGGKEGIMRRVQITDGPTAGATGWIIQSETVDERNYLYNNTPKGMRYGK